MKIKSCPFCGSNDLEIGHSNEDREGVPIYIFCGNCGAQGPWFYIEKITDDIEYICELSEWNRRI